MWVRGLKRQMLEVNQMREKSHPMWVRGLKLITAAKVDDTEGRTPCGCVD